MRARDEAGLAAVKSDSGVERVRTWHAAIVVAACLWLCPILCQAQDGQRLPWPGTATVLAECSDDMIAPSMTIVKEQFTQGNYSDASDAGETVISTLSECLKQYGYPWYSLYRAWAEDFTGASYVKLGKTSLAQQLFSASGKDLKVVAAYDDLPPAIATMYSIVESDLKAFTGSSTPQSPSEIARNYFASADWKDALKAYRDFAHDPQGQSLADVYWHLAIASDHLGDSSGAAKYIRQSMHDISDSDAAALKGQIKYDYNRLGGAKLDAQIVASTKREALAEAHAALADEHSYWDGLSYDEQQVVTRYGGSRDSNDDARPCNVSVSDSSYIGELVIWYYDCSDEDSIGRESWTFVNGTLTEHTTI